MQDMSGAHSVAPDGSRLGIMPTTSGGVATSPRAPGQERPRTVPHSTARPDCLCATPRAPGADVPPASVAGAPGQYRLSAAPSVPVLDRSRPVQRAPGRSPRHPARQGMTVRAPPSGHRVLTYPRPRRPGRRVSTVRVPRIGRKITSDLAPRQRRRVMADPSPRHPTWWGMTVRAPPLGRRIRTYPGPGRPGRRVLIVRAPWPPPRRQPTDPTSCPRRQVPIAPIVDPPPGHRPPPSPTPPCRPTTWAAGRIPPRRCNSSPKPTMHRCSLPRSAYSIPSFGAPRGWTSVAPWTCCGACSRTGRC